LGIHFLPEGGNGRATDPGSPDLIETAATRGLFQKEARRDTVAGTVSDVVTSDSGLTHVGAPVGTGGARRSVNAFILRFQTEDEWRRVVQLLRRRRAATV